MSESRATENCPICGSLSSHSFNAKKYAFSKCSASDCRHVYVDPMPTFEELNTYYAKNTSGLENSDSWTMVEDYKANPEIVHNFYNKNRISFLKRKMFLKPDSSVLDVGCSTGMFLRVLKDSGYTNLVGVDVSIEQVTHCREVNEIDAYRDLSQVPENRLFDLVSLYAVLEHVPNPDHVMKQAVERIAPGGKLIVDVPNYRSVYRVLSRKKWLWLIPPVHLQYFTPRSMEKLARRNGLTVSYASTKSTSTYTYILAYHVFDVLRREMPTTSLSTSRIRALVVAAVENALRLLFLPLSLIMRFSGTHNQIIYVFSREGNPK
jgi:2-polyprenyl-3-methyl-5-hydroxy-6-metoxy-1,4-benzoquinol methylase